VKNKSFILILVGMLIVVAGLFFLFKEGSEEPIGGNRDEHGCLGPAGYSYDEEMGACIRSWELDQEQRQIVQPAVDYLGKDNGLTVIKVEKEGDDNSYFVFLQKADSSQVKVEIKDNHVVEVYPRWRRLEDLEVNLLFRLIPVVELASQFFLFCSYFLQVIINFLG